MRISSVTAHHVRIPFKVAFTHALKYRRETETIIVEIASENGDTGIGEILPRPYLTGETVWSVLDEALPQLASRWIGQVLQDPEDVVAMLRRELLNTGRTLATFSGCELALLDLAGKTFGFPAGDVLGPERAVTLASGIVIDFNVATDALTRYCTLLRLAGHKHVKLKVGRKDDFQRIEIASGILGPDVPLSIDANGTWMADEAIRFLRSTRRFTIRSVEQPVAAGDLDGMKKVREETGIPVVADESLCSVDDAGRLIAASAADVFNIRIGKCGGLLASADLVKLAIESGLRWQLGTLVGETGILLRAAEIFGQRVQGSDFLEGKDQDKLLLAEDLLSSPPMQEATGTGLGITISRSQLARWAASSPILFQSSLGRLA